MYGWTHYYLEEGSQYTILVDLILIVLAITGAAGYGIYWLIRRGVESHVTQLTKEAANYVNAAVRGDEAFSLWSLSDKFSRRRNRAIAKTYLEAAIDPGRKSVSLAEELDEKETRNEKLICNLKSNLAFYLAELGHEADKPEAQKLGRYAYTRAKKHEDPWEWKESYAWALFNFLNSTEKEKKEARKIVKQLLPRPDVPDDIEQWLRARYNLPAEPERTEN